MGLDPAKVTTRSNSDLCTVERVLSDTSMSPAARMEFISLLGQQWDKATEGSTERFRTVREIRRRFPAQAVVLLGREVTPGHPTMEGAGYDCHCGECLYRRES
jgi:hypothetical protein